MPRRNAGSARWRAAVAAACAWAAAGAHASVPVAAQARTPAPQGLAPCGPESTFAPSADYSFSWRVCGDSLFGTVAARATGWVAVGFSRDQYMPGTDVFMAGVRSDGTAYGVDAYAFLRNPPVHDASQDVTLLAATEVAGITSYSFSRLLRTGDAVDFDLTDGPYHVLAAFQASSDSLTVRHSFADASDLPFLFAPVPEPGTLALLAAGIAVVGGAARRRGG